MQTTTRRRTVAPYTVGGTIRLLHDSRQGVALGDLPIIRVTALADGRWRVTATRDHPVCSTVEVVVGADGRDRDGYVVVPS